MEAPQPIFRLARLAVAVLLGFAAAGANAQDRYAVAADGSEVTDTGSRLVWRRCIEGLQWNGTACTGKPMKFKFGEAKRHAADAAKGGSQAWRLPTRSELVSLIDKTPKKKRPLIDTAAFPQTPNLQFWATRPGSDDDLNAWLVNFANGRVYGNVGKARFPLRLVRAGP